MRTGGRLSAHFHLHFCPGRSEEDRIRNEYEESQWTGDRDTRSSMVSEGGPAASSSAQLITVISWNQQVEGNDLVYWFCVFMHVLMSAHVFSGVLCSCVLMCVLMCVCMHGHTCSCVHVCVYVCACMLMHIFMCVHACVFMFVCACLCVCLYVHV